MTGALALAPFAARGATSERRDEAPAETLLVALCRRALAASDDIAAAYREMDAIPETQWGAFERDPLDALYARHAELEAAVIDTPARTFGELLWKGRVATWNGLDGVEAHRQSLEYSIMRDLMLLGRAS